MHGFLTLHRTAAVIASLALVGVIGAGCAPGTDTTEAAGLAGAAGVTATTTQRESAAELAAHVLQPKAAIVFSQANPGGNGVHLRIGDPLGLGSRPLTSPVAGVYVNHATKSPDRRRVLFEYETPDGLFMGMVDLARPGVVKIIDSGCHATPDCEGEVAPSWSSDGKRVLFQRVIGPFNEEGDAVSAVLYSVKLDGTDLRRVSALGVDPVFEDVGPRFSPDGKWMVFIRATRIDGILKFAIFKSRADGSDAQQMTPWDLNGDRPSVSPARSGPTVGLVAFETYGGAAPGRGDVALIPLGCPSVDACMAAIRYITHNHPGPKSAFAASWSPDGRFVAYAEEPRLGWADVWTNSWDGSRPHQMTKEVLSYSPAWGR